MKVKQKCPHCGRKVYEVITLKERIEKEGMGNACEHCRFDDNDIRDKVDLKEMYVRLNKTYFNDKLPAVSRVKIEWNTDMRSTAGRCWRSRKLIHISSYYHNLHPDELESTVAHEMIHLKEAGHRAGFKREADRITKMGLEITIYTKYSEGIPPKWNYICVNEECGETYERVQRLKNFKNCRCHVCDSKLKEVQLRE